MEEYKANSHRAKEAEKSLPAERQKVSPVAKGKVIKKTGVKKFTDVFVSEDIQNVKSYVVMDVLIPAVKKAVSDIVTNGIDMLLYGETRGHKRSSASYVSYDRFSDRDRRDDRRSSRSRNMFDYDEITFSRAEAEDVLDRMYEILDTYQVVSVLDLYDLADVSNDNIQTKKYGWTSLRNAEVVRAGGGEWRLKLPKPLPID